MGKILEIENLHVHYHDGTEALKGATLSLEQGAKVGLIGPNGAGKTSLMLAILHAVRFSGRIVVDGLELSRRTAEEARSRCSLAFQDADDQLFMPTLLDDVAFGPLNQGLGGQEALARARAAIAAVALDGLENRSAHHLSGGQKRMASLATILSMHVRLLLLDEPGANLDFRSRKRLIEILAARQEAMLLASHDLDMIRRLCSRVILLDEGRVAAEGPLAEVLDNPALLAAHGLA